jgi:glutaconate CoA-transferase subunit B
MAVRAAKELNDRDVVFVGIGLPNLACNLARATHAPNLVLIYESGAVGAVPDRLPVSIGDPALVTDSLAVASMADIFQLYLQGGRIQVGFLGGAQVDRYANITSPGQAGKYGTRRELGLPGGGPRRIVTDVGVLEPSSTDGELELVGIYPDVSADDVKSKTGWPLRVRDDLERIPPPTAEELRLLREVLDPTHLYV